MHFLGVAGMPRRIPGAQPAFTYKFINNGYRNFAERDECYKKPFLFISNEIPKR
jgi:hypothetical protein